MKKLGLFIILLLCAGFTFQKTRRASLPSWVGEPPKINLGLSNTDQGLVATTRVSWQPGLLGEYFGDEALTIRQVMRVDPKIDFYWETAPYDPDGTYGVRWTGHVNIPTAGSWKFITTSDDGVRLFIDDVLVVENWTTHPPTQNEATLTLPAGWHSLKLEHFNQWFQFYTSATMKLEFEGPNQPRTVIPESSLCLYPEAGAQPRTYRLSDGRSYTLKALLKR